MKVRYGLLAGLCLALSVPLAILLLQRRSAAVVPVVRVATFNASLNRPGEGELLAELRTGKSEQAAAIAEIVQRAGVDVLLVCELDRDRAAETAALLARGWFAVSQRGQQPIDFEFCYAGEVNTGEDKPKIFPQEIFPLEDAPKKYTKQVHFRLHTAHLKPESMESVREVIAAHPGKCPLMFCFRYPTGQTVFVEPHERYAVMPSRELQAAVNEKFGEDTYYVKVDMSLPEKQNRWGKKADYNNGGGSDE